MKSSLILFLPVLLTLSSCASQEFYSMEDFQSVRKVDTHTHPNTYNTAMAEQARDDNFIILAVNVDVPAYPSLAEQQEMALAQIRAAPDNVVFLTAISLENWDDMNWVQGEIDRIRPGLEKGALGIKLWKNIGMVYKDSMGNFIMVDDSRFDPLVAFLQERDKTLMAHLGEPKNCWLPLDSMTVNGDRNYYRRNPQYHMFLHPENPSYEDLINARDRFLANHPGIRFVGAHLGSLEWSVDELAKRLDQFPNMAVDMAARISHLQYQSRMDRERVRAFLIKYKDRITYATDAAMSEDSDPAETRKSLHERWLADWKYLVTDEMITSPQVNGDFQGLQLPKDVVDHIYFKNAIRWFKIPQ